LIVRDTITSWSSSFHGSLSLWTCLHFPPVLLPFSFWLWRDLFYFYFLKKCLGNFEKNEFSPKNVRPRKKR
jgi:hypothetical protein